MPDSFKKLIIEAHGMNRDEPAPHYAAVDLSPSFIDLVRSLQKSVIDLGVSRIEQEHAVEWEDNEEHRISRTELSVDRDYFYFSAWPKLNDYPVETTTVPIKDLEPFLADEAAEVFYGSDINELMECRNPFADIEPD